MSQILPKTYTCVPHFSEGLIYATSLLRKSYVSTCFCLPKEIWRGFLLSKKKRWKMKIAFSICFTAGITEAPRTPSKESGTARQEYWSSHSLLQGIFPTQGSNPGLPHCRRILYHLSHQGSPRILEWAAYPFSRGSSQPRNWTRVFCIAGGFFTN